MADRELICDVCRGESGAEYVGVRSIALIPLSIPWCAECVQRRIAPAYIFQYEFSIVADGDLEKFLRKWGDGRETWADGRYMDCREYVQRITPEMVRHKAQWEEFRRHTKRSPARDSSFTEGCSGPESHRSGTYRRKGTR